MRRLRVMGTTQVSDVIVLGGAASTYYCTRPRVRINSFLGDDAAEMKFRSSVGGRQVLKCKKSELLVMYQLYALCCSRQRINHRDCRREIILPTHRHAPMLRADVCGRDRRQFK